MGKHLPTTVWGFRPHGKYPNGYVRTVGTGHVEVTVCVAPDDCYGFRMSRRMAKAVANRILQMLEATRA